MKQSTHTHTHTHTHTGLEQGTRRKGCLFIVLLRFYQQQEKGEVHEIEATGATSYKHSLPGYLLILHHQYLPYCLDERAAQSLKNMLAVFSSFSVQITGRARTIFT